jgi:hypothetical protein
VLAAAGRLRKAGAYDRDTDTSEESNETGDRRLGTATESDGR